jgi:hypothetical protein
MSKIASIGTLCIAAVIALLAIPIATAKKVADPPSAPVPIQILTGKKVFISNGESNAETNIPNLPYNAFYASMQSWGKYELVPAPADADLVFEVRYIIFTAQKGLFGYGNPVLWQLHLLILDPKTHIVLWAFNEDVEDAILDSTARKNFDQAMAYLVDDVKKLTAPPEATTDAPAPNK